MNMKYITPALILILLISGQIFARDEFDVFSVPYKDETKTIEIDVNIPVIIGMENKTIQGKYDKKIRENIFHFISEIEEGANDYYIAARKGNFPFHKGAALVKFEVTNKERILSIIIKYYQFTGGAHGLTTWVSYNIALKTGEDLPLAEFLDLTDLNSDRVDSMIKDEIAKKPDQYFTGEMGFKNMSETQSYYIENNKLVVFFQQYEIAPYVTGLPEFRIPFSYSKNCN